MKAAMMHHPHAAPAAHPARCPRASFASSSSALGSRPTSVSSPSTKTNLAKLLKNRRRIIPVAMLAPHAVADGGGHKPSRAISFDDATPTEPPIDLHAGGVRNEQILLALPAVLGQAIDPLAQLMETAYIGRLGLGNLSAVVLLSLLICVFWLGITRAAISTVASQ